MSTNIITAVFGALKKTVTATRFRYDYGQKLKIVGLTLPDVYEVHFANVGASEAQRMLNTGDTVDIPDALFETGADILAWIYLHDTATDGETMYTILIPIAARAEPEGYDPESEEADILAQAIALLNQEITDIEGAAQHAQDAQAAQTAAELAQTAAEGAAREASGSATAAERDAGAAAQSARDAADAKTAAETAQGRAEAAATHAEQYGLTASFVGNTLTITHVEG